MVGDTPGPDSACSSTAQHLGAAGSPPPLTKLLPAAISSVRGNEAKLAPDS